MIRHRLQQQFSGPMATSGVMSWWSKEAVDWAVEVACMEWNLLMEPSSLLLGV